MWDDRTPRTRVAFSELDKKVEDMYLMAGATFASVAHLYLFRHILTETGAWAMLGKMRFPCGYVSSSDDDTDPNTEQQVAKSDYVRREALQTILVMEGCQHSDEWRR